MKIERIPALFDNYIFLLQDSQSNIAAVVDPAISKPVLDQVNRLGLELVAIFNTHHHSDHVGGNSELIAHFPHLTVYGGAQDKGRIPSQQVFLQERDTVSFGNRTAEVFFVPGHTKAHIAYYFPPEEGEDWGELFCGDTLFGGGCGRLFEGSPAQMVASLSKFRELPDQTRVWCAHEYTLKNLQFALTVDGDNPDLMQRVEEVKEARRHCQATIPSDIGTEKRTNPFLRWDHPQIQGAMNSCDPIETFARLRAKKDLF
jgi:hydroxyacylglutathione hydrolase